MILLFIHLHTIGNKRLSNQTDMLRNHNEAN